jgi:hypothetical protein
MHNLGTRQSNQKLPRQLLEMLTLEDIQSQLEVHGVHGFQAIRVSLHTRDLRQFLESRIRLFQEKRPDAPILKSVYAAMVRLSSFSCDENIYRWEAESEIGKIVGYSVHERIIFIFHWVQKDHEWVASIICV